MHQEIIERLKLFLDRPTIPPDDWPEFARAVRASVQADEARAGWLNAILDAVPALVYVKSTDGVYKVANAAYARLLGTEANALLGKTDHEFLIAEVAEAQLDLDRLAMLAQESHVSERWMGDPDGNQICLETRRTPYFDAQGRLMGTVGVCRDITESKIAQETISRQAQFDPLTQLPNRRNFQDRLAHELQLAQRSRLSVALLLVGLDKFRSVNETYGTETGDAVLAQVAFRIPDVVRTTDTCARLGGDEFAVIIPSLHDVTDVERVAQNIINRLAEPFIVGDEQLFITASVGIALFPNNATDLDTLQKNAAQAMYYAKSTGRSRFSHFTFALQEAAARRLRLGRELRRAVEHRKFEVMYQPIVDLRTGATRGAEALVAWQHEGRGRIGPMEFIPLAEDSGAMVEIGDWVFREAASQAQQARQVVGPDFVVSVNQSPMQLRSPRCQPVEWLEYLATLGLGADALMLELTEDILLRTEEPARLKLVALHAAGVRLAVDDFGTGQASLTGLRRHPIDVVKIDPSCVRAVESDAAARALCEAIIAMAHKLGQQVIAEGVETEGQRAFLAAAGCDMAQGYLLARPMSGADLMARLAAPAASPG